MIKIFYKKLLNKEVVIDEILIDIKDCVLNWGFRRYGE